MPTLTSFFSNTGKRHSPSIELKLLRVHCVNLNWLANLYSACTSKHCLTLLCTYFPLPPHTLSLSLSLTLACIQMLPHLFQYTSRTLWPREMLIKNSKCPKYLQSSTEITTTTRGGGSAHIKNGRWAYQKVQWSRRGSGEGGVTNSDSAFSSLFKLTRHACLCAFYSCSTLISG